MLLSVFVQCKVIDTQGHLREEDQAHWHFHPSEGTSPSASLFCSLGLTLSPAIPRPLPFAPSWGLVS